MIPIFDLLERGYLVVALAILAGGLFFWKRRTGSLFFALLALGGLLSLSLKFLDGTFLDRFTIGLAGAAVAALVVLVSTGRWSWWVGAGLAVVSVLTLGAWSVPSAQAVVPEVTQSLASVEFVEPFWLFLLGFVPVVIVVASRSLSGLGPVRKVVAVTLRCLLVSALALALAEPRLKRPADNVAVLYVIDRSLSIPQEVDAATADSPGGIVDARWKRIQNFINEAVARKGSAHRDDQSGVLFFARRPQLVLPASAIDRIYVSDALAGPLDNTYTDISAALKLATASFPDGVGKRILLISDGNENLGNAEAQARLARQNGIEIDTLPLAKGYRNENEVLVQAVDAPPQTARGTRLPIRVLIRNANPNRVVRGKLELLQSKDGADRPVSIQPGADVIDGSRSPAVVQLRPGLNVFTFRDRVEGVEKRDKKDDEFSYTYRAIFQPLESVNREGQRLTEGLPGDRVQNNRSLAHVIVRGQRRVLFVEQDASAGVHQHLIEQLRTAKFNVVPISASRLPLNRADLTVFLSNYDCLVLADVPAEMLREQQEVIRSNTYDQGCGLVMIGGSDSYGAGGYHKTPIEAALPVDCDIKAMQAAGKGGLVLIMHASEMADGNKWQKDIAKLAIQRLNAVDMVGVLDYGGLNPNWHIPFQSVGEDRGRLLAMIDRLVPGDMPDFDPFLQSAHATLADPKHGLAVKHTILISDGDPQLGPIGMKALADMVTDGVTCTTVGVATHGASEDQKMLKIASSAAKGSKFYPVTDPAKLPAIYMKESRRVSQSYIFDKRFNPKLLLRGGTTDKLEAPLPDLFGFVRTTMKNSPLAEMLIEGPRVFDQRFPILAAWQYGLGRSVAFTSDAKTIPGTKEGWDRQWAGSEIYGKFWEQAITWAMRGTETDRLVLTTEYQNGKVRVRVEALDENNKPLTDLILQGGMTSPKDPKEGQKKPELKFQQTSSGVYEAEFKSEEDGTYLINVAAKQSVPMFPDGKPRYKGRQQDGLPMTVSPAPGDPNRGTLADGTPVKKDAQGNWLYADDGKPVEVQDRQEKLLDSRRTGVTLAYSPEFGDLESNSALLERLSAITGGKVYTEDAAALQALARSGDIYRPVPTSLKSLQPLWFWLVFAAGIVLLFDVAVRRVAVEMNEVRAGLSKVWTRLRDRGADASAKEDSFLAQLRQRKETVVESIEKEKAARRFESEAGKPTEASPGADTGPIVLPPILTRPPVEEPKPEPEPEEGGDDYFSKLKRAKKRAPLDKPKDEE